ncbi:MAG: hypothetical protein ACNI28_06680 [Arcobacter sp.]|uniref:hypothetical protein n=1 Tax=Arcobacter sp. TaxID=1872629 RepID=UPI003AFF9141
MNINSYEEHVGIVKELKMADSFYEVREPYKDSFEELYNKAKDEKVSISNAKEFLNSLSKEELSTLQHYTLLADDINVDSLSDEGAYNLLLHHYEKYDFDNDGLVSNGISKGMGFIPINIPNSDKELLVESLNELDEKDRFLSMAMLFPMPMLKEENGEIIQVGNKEEFDYDYILNRIDGILNPPPGSYSSPELKSTFRLFKEVLERNYEELVQKSEQINTDIANNTTLMKAKINS